MATPDVRLYKDINASTDLPPVCLENMEAYLAPFDKKLEDKVKNLYHERFLLCVRASRDGQKNFIMGRCAAEMKKSTVYRMDVLLDDTGTVCECQCECAVGMGPGAHCKHVVCLLYGLVSFTSTKSITVHETCTQKLQTFHKCKPYKGSPLKTCQLKLTEGKSSGIFNYSDADPRPADLVGQPGYAAYFSNLCIGFEAARSGAEAAMPIVQNIPPANIYGVANDHDYLCKHAEDVFLEAFGIQSISSEERCAIESKTRKQQASQLWREERMKRMQSSNFGRICKATPRTDHPNLAASFLETKDLRTAPILHGKKYEPVAVAAYEAQRSVSTSPCGLFVCSDYPFLGSSPDRVVDDSTLLEVKCPYVSRDKEIDEVTVPYLKKVDDEFTLDRKHDYYYQVQGQLLCANRHCCDFVVFTMKDLKICQIPRNEEFISDMVQKLTKFYRGYFRSAILEHFFYRKSSKYSFDY